MSLTNRLKKLYKEEKKAIEVMLIENDPEELDILRGYRDVVREEIRELETKV